MIRYFVCLSIYLVAYLLNLVVAPIYSLFTANGWPTWGYWLQTPDNLPVGDRQYMREGAWFPGLCHSGIKAWVNRSWWITFRNVLLGMAVSLLGFMPKEGDTIVATGDKNVGDKRKVPGVYTQKVYRDGKVVAFQIYCIYRWNDGYCFRARIGWKLSSWPNPKMNDRYAFCVAITPLKKW
jgi:hypothetical protein